MRAWYPGPRDDEVFRHLERETASFAELVRDEPSSCDVLIEGRPIETQLEKVREGGAVIVPFAGVPPATLGVLKTRSDLSLHNLHHNAAETAETTLALLLAAAKRLHTADRALRQGDWTPRYTPEETVKLEGKTALILGMGAIGRRVAAGCRSLGMEVIGVSRSGAKIEGFEIHPWVELQGIYERAHALILAVPLTEETKDLVGLEELKRLRKPSFLVNTARAQIVKERDLYEALRDGVLQGAGMDVWYRYPKHPEGVVPGYFSMPEEAKRTFPSDFPLHELESMVMSPHRGGASREAEEGRVEQLAELLRAFVEKGEMPNRVNLELGY